VTPMSKRTSVREADLFFSDLYGVYDVRPVPERPTVSAPHTRLQQEASQAARIFDRIAHRGELTTEVFFESDAGDPSALGPWRIVAPPSSATPVDRLRSGDLVVQRALGDGQLASLLVLDEDIEPPTLYGADGLIRADTLVLRSAVPAEGDSFAFVESDAESPPTVTPVVASPRRTGARWLEAAHAGFLGKIPERTSSKRGRRVLLHARVAKSVGYESWLEPAAIRARDEIIVKEIKKGNIPDYLRRGKVVAIAFTDDDGKAHGIMYQVMPDYLAIGTDENHVMVPLTAPAAQSVADAFGCILPTAHMVDQIMKQAGGKLAAQPRPYYQDGSIDRKTGRRRPFWDPSKDSKLLATHNFDDLLKLPDRQMSTAAYIEHDLAIKRQLKEMAIERAIGMPLLAGHKKDLVIAASPDRQKLQFYGWYTIVKGKAEPIQAIKNRPGFPVNAHGPLYVDYSHGVRLVAGTMVADGREMSAAEVLAHPILSKGLSKEGPITSPRVPQPAQPARARRARTREASEDLESAAVREVAADPRSRPGPGAVTPAIAAPPAFQILAPTQAPLVNARWSVHQNDRTFTGAVKADGWTGPIDPAGKFDPSQPFRVHVAGCVCSIVSGAMLLASDPSVEYGGQFVDWSLADDTNFQKRSTFWGEYERARKIHAPLDVFRFLQHDHVMRRPVKLLARYSRAVFEARPLAIRLGPIVRYVDTRCALIWLELETPGLVRVTFGKANDQGNLPAAGDVPPAHQDRFTTSVRVGGRHYAVVRLEGLAADSVYQYTITLAPQPPVGALPVAQADFTPAVFPREPVYGSHATLKNVLQQISLAGSEWLFFRSAPRGSDRLRFAHGSCRKWPGDHDAAKRSPGPDMLEVFGNDWLRKKAWSEWPRFFLHTGDQIYADDVGVTMGGVMLRHRFAAVAPGPSPSGGADVASGAWAGRFRSRYAPLGSPQAPRDDLDQLRALRPRAKDSSHDLDLPIKRALRARAQAAFATARAPLPLRFTLRVANGLLWHVPDEENEIPRVDLRHGLRSRQIYRLEGPPAREFHIEYPAAGDTEGVHAADFAEYAALYQQAWNVPGARRVLAHLSSYMLFDDHDVTDDWNADAVWLKIVHSNKDPRRFWTDTVTDALCAYWIYQGWGNLAPEQWARDPRVEILERSRKSGRDALPELRRLVASRAVDTTAPGADASGKLDWNFTVPAGDIPFLAIDLRTDLSGRGVLSKARHDWLEQALAGSRSPVAFVVLPVPYLMPDPMLFAFRNPAFVGFLAGARSTAAFKRSSDIEHPAGLPVWDQIKGILSRLQQTSRLKTVVFLAGDIHFSSNLDGQLRGSRRPPRMLQLISSGLRQAITSKKQGQLTGAYNTWLNAISRAQGVDVHRSVRITLGGLHEPSGGLRNFLFEPSVAMVDVKMTPYGPASARTTVPLVQQTHLTRDAKGKVVGYRFRHMTQGDGSAVMTLKDPGFEHPASPKDYPAAVGGIGVAREMDEWASEEDEQQIVTIEPADGMAVPLEAPEAKAEVEAAGGVCG
jgi:hypothetical protein